MRRAHRLIGLGMAAWLCLHPGTTLAQSTPRDFGEIKGWVLATDNGYPPWVNDGIELVHFPTTSVQASSTLAHKKNLYRPEHAFDGKDGTVWAEGRQGAGEGEWISITLKSPFPNADAFRSQAMEAIQHALSLEYFDPEVDGTPEENLGILRNSGEYQSASASERAKLEQEFQTNLADQKTTMEITLAENAARMQKMTNHQLAMDWRGFPHLAGISILPGLVNPGTYYRQNARPKRVRLEVSHLDVDGNPRKISAFFLVEDKPREQVYPLDDSLGKIPMIGQITFRFTVESVYPGSKYQDLVVTDIAVIFYRLPPETT